MHTPFQHAITDAPAMCKEMGGRLPEARDKKSAEAIRFYAIKHGIKKIAA